ncbi:MAG: MBL fold metallo-hydrolase [Desulfuromonadales bacterium]|nr:MBL fold metallo-hydrolase [Desulfuromonadales bacterium]
MIPIQHTLQTGYMIGPVHCYSATLNGELVLFDSGPPTEAAKEYLSNTLDLQQLKHVIMTHCHIDHYGLASWLEQESDATIYLPYRDSLKIERHQERLDKQSDLLLDLGYDRGFAGNFMLSMNDGTTFPDFPRRYRIVEQDLPGHLGLEVLSCAGHSQSDLVYATAEWAVTGDVLLRGVFQSPLLDVDLETGQRFRNYDAYCATIGKLATLRGRRILPGHRKDVDSVDAPILFYLDKMLTRAAALKPFRASGNVAEIVRQLFGERLEKAFHIYLKASEIVFLLDFLDAPEQLRSVLEEIDLFETVAGKYRQATEP